MSFRDDMRHSSASQPSNTRSHLAQYLGMQHAKWSCMCTIDLSKVTLVVVLLDTFLRFSAICSVEFVKLCSYCKDAS